MRLTYAVRCLIRFFAGLLLIEFIAKLLFTWQPLGDTDLAFRLYRLIFPGLLGAFAGAMWIFSSEVAAYVMKGDNRAATGLRIGTLVFVALNAAQILAGTIYWTVRSRNPVVESSFADLLVGTDHRTVSNMIVLSLAVIVFFLAPKIGPALGRWEQVRILRSERE